MQSGDLDRRIVLQRATVTLDGFGGEVETWAPLRTVWAQYLPGPGREAWRSAEVAAVTEARFIIRWGQGVTVRDRVLYDGKVYDVRGVIEIGRREGQELSVSSRADTVLDEDGNEALPYTVPFGA